MIEVKICGITSPVDAKLAVSLGADAIGMIVYPQSPRALNLSRARTIAESLSGTVAIVGVFVDEPPDRVRELVDQLGLDWIQLSGHESAADYHGTGAKIIQVIHVGNDEAIDIHASDGADAILLDNRRQGLYGGTGETFNWSLVDVDQFDVPVILSGGLNATNIAQGIAEVKPAAVDVSSGVEASAGIKDRLKMRSLFDVLSDVQTKKGGLFQT